MVKIVVPPPLALKSLTFDSGPDSSHPNPLLSITICQFLWSSRYLLIQLHVLFTAALQLA
jgi:hypothetical protein